MNPAIAIALSNVFSGILNGISQYSLNSQNQAQARQDREYNNPANQVQRLVAAGINPNSAIGNISNTYSLPANSANGSTIGTEIFNSLSQASSNLYSMKRQKELDEFNKQMRQEDLLLKQKDRQLKEQELKERQQNYEMNRLLMGEKYLFQSFQNSFNNTTFMQKVKQSILDTTIKQSIADKNNLMLSLYPSYYASIIDKNIAGTSKLYYDMFQRSQEFSYKKQKDKADYKLRGQSLLNNYINQRYDRFYKTNMYNLAKERLNYYISKNDWKSAQYWIDFLTGNVSGALQQVVGSKLAPYRKVW